MCNNFRNWLATALRDGKDLIDETIYAVSNFTLMWRMFEGTECETQARIGHLEQFAQR